MEQLLIKMIKITLNGDINSIGQFDTTCTYRIVTTEFIDNKLFKQ